MAGKPIDDGPLQKKTAVMRKATDRQDADHRGEGRRPRSRATELRAQASRSAAT